MMGIVVPETCWAYEKYNKIISSIYLVLIRQLSQWCMAPTNIRTDYVPEQQY